jgi:hypothetical protein
MLGALDDQTNTISDDIIDSSESFAISLTPNLSMDTKRHGGGMSHCGGVFETD